MVPYSGFAKSVSICLLDNVLLRGIVDIGSFIMPTPFSVRGIPAAETKATKEITLNKKGAIVAIMAQCYETKGKYSHMIYKYLYRNILSRSNYQVASYQAAAIIKQPHYQDLISFETINLQPQCALRQYVK
jgi:predicted YcjX-like family ATPase